MLRYQALLKNLRGNRLQRYVLVLILAFVISFVLSRTTFYQRVKLDLQDEQMVQFAPAIKFQHTLVVDVDEDSIATLTGSLGAWPYDREVFGLIIQYLKNAGAKVVAFDVVFAEPRKGDKEFAQAIQSAQATQSTDVNRPTQTSLPARNENISSENFSVVLAAAMLPNDIQRPPAYHHDLRRLAWLNVDELAAENIPQNSASVVDKTARTAQLSWPDMTLPAPEILRPAPNARVGVVTVVPDVHDGHVRRVPTLHEAYGSYLPSLPLAALIAAESGTANKPQIKWDADNTHLFVNKYKWPINAKGEVTLHFGRGVHEVPAVPFHEVMAAALGVSGFERVADAVRGKTIFIGSSAARLGDFVQTPMGRTRGLYLVATAHELLATHRVLNPPNVIWDGVLILLALIVPTVAYMSRMGNSAAFAWASGPAVIVLVLGASSVMLLLGQQTAMLFALTLAVNTLLLQFLQRMAFLYRNQQHLKLEKVAAEKAAELKKKFISNMTHELRTPLTAVLGYNRLLAEKETTPAERQRYTAVIEKSGQHLLSLINDMLDQAKIEAGQMTVVIAPTDIRLVVQDAIEGLQAIAGEKKLTLRAEWGEGVPQGMAAGQGLNLDGFRLKQVLINLIGNGIKFTRRGGVTVRVNWSADKLTIEVMDTGQGMDEEQLTKMFQAFQQADEHVAKTHGGTGLGLSISQELTRLMGGEITVRSKPGVGTTFQIEMPATACVLTNEQPVLLSPSVLVAPSDSTQATQHLILIVDDSDELRMLLDYQIQSLGMKTVLAENGEQMVALARERKPTMVLTDMEMPLLDGVEATRQLRASGFTGPIAALTGHSVGPETDRALAAGCNECLQKPVSMQKLQALLQKYLP